MAVSLGLTPENGAKDSVFFTPEQRSFHSVGHGFTF